MMILRAVKVVSWAEMCKILIYKVRTEIVKVRIQQHGKGVSENTLLQDKSNGYVKINELQWLRTKYSEIFEGG